MSGAPQQLRPECEPQREELVLHGRKLSYLRAGEGPLLLLLHGIASDALTWEAAIPLLARGHTVIAPDLPGHGESSAGAGDYSLGAHAATLRDLLVVTGHERATLIGHSLGGGISMQFAYLFPERTERLVLVSSGGLGRSVNPLLRAATLPGSELVIDTAVAPLTAAGTWVARQLARAGLRPASDLGGIGRGFASLADRARRAAFLASLRAVVGAGGQVVDARDRLYLAVEMPTLLVWGERDPIIPVWHGRRAQQLMPGSELEILPEAGHFPQLDEPGRFAAVVLDFIGRTDPSTFTAEHWGELLRAGALPESEPPRRRGDGAPRKSQRRRSGAQ
jgi:pimeloyl-ACP methyl ester carboxylesterase